jgi:hypothetical protein
MIAADEKKTAQILAVTRYRDTARRDQLLPDQGQV